MVALAVAACGRSHPSKLSQLEAEVDSAMAGLPYAYRVLDRYSTRNYVVVRVGNTTPVDIAYGGKSEGGRCPAMPELPAKHRRSRPFVAAGPERLICFEDDGWRPSSRQADAITPGNIAYIVANALCEEVYRGFDSFACFD